MTIPRTDSPAAPFAPPVPSPSRREEPPAGPRRSPRFAGVPSWGDPRIPFAAILTTYLVMGVVWLGFNRSPGQILAIVAIGCGLDVALHALLRKRELIVPLSAYISSISIAILLNFAHDYAVLALPIFLSIGSKYLFTFDGKHHYNPSLFGVVLTLLFAGNLISAAPAYQWGGTLAISTFIVTLALAGFVFRIGRGWLIASFLITYVLQTGLRAWIMRAHLPPEMLFLGTLTAPPFFLFTFFMLTDPRTSPRTRGAQIAVGVSIALVDLVLHRFRRCSRSFTRRSSSRRCGLSGCMGRPRGERESVIGIRACAALTRSIARFGSACGDHGGRWVDVLARSASSRRRRPIPASGFARFPPHRADSKW